MTLPPCPAWCTYDHTDQIVDDLVGHGRAVGEVAGTSVWVGVVDNLTDRVRSRAGIEVLSRDTLTAAQARRLALVLLDAYEMCEAYNGARNP